MEVLIEFNREVIEKHCNIGDIGMFPTNVDHIKCQQTGE